MATGPATRRRARWVLGLAVLAVVLVLAVALVGAGGSFLVWRHGH